MVNASAYFDTGNGSGNSFPESEFSHSKIGEGAFYQPYEVNTAGNMHSASNTSRFFPFHINSDAKIRSLLLNITANETRGLRFGVYEITDYLKRGAEVFSGSVADSTLSTGNNEIMLAAPVSIVTGWYMFGFSGLGAGSNISPNFQVIAKDTGLPSLVRRLPVHRGLVAYGDLVRLSKSSKLDGVAENDGLSLSIGDFPAFAFGMEV